MDDELAQNLIALAQDGFPLTPLPYAALAQWLGSDEQTILDTLRQLKQSGVLSRIGAVYKPGSVGASCLAALKVPPERVEAVAEQVSAYPEINHNYLREHVWNLWFVVTAPNMTRRDTVLDDIERQTALPMLRLPMVESYYINLGFTL